MSLSSCGFWINASLLLNYETASAESYVKIGVNKKAFKHNRPYYEWLGTAIKTLDVEDQALAQVQRDVYLSNLLFDTKAVQERATVDLVHLFVQDSAKVYVASHETPDALSAIIARCDMPETVEQLFLLTKQKRLDELANLLNSAAAPDYLFVLEYELDAATEKAFRQILADKGELINVKTSSQINEAVDKLALGIQRLW